MLGKHRCGAGHLYYIRDRSHGSRRLSAIDHRHGCRAGLFLGVSAHMQRTMEVPDVGISPSGV